MYTFIKAEDYDKLDSCRDITAGCIPGTASTPTAVGIPAILVTLNPNAVFFDEGTKWVRLRFTKELKDIFIDQDDTDFSFLEGQDLYDELAKLGDKEPRTYQELAVWMFEQSGSGLYGSFVKIINNGDIEEIHRN